MIQRIISAENDYSDLSMWIKNNDIKRLFVVCDASLEFLEIKKYFEKLNSKISVTYFDDFKPNPLYESVVSGVMLYRSEKCDAIVAVGGGSAIDVAKCIKLYSNMDGNGYNGEFLKKEIVPNDIPFLAMPTTAGTGSEATRYAVIYYEGYKQSVTSESCIPGTVLMDPGCLKTLPVYQKKSTLLDALCHSIESYWSVNSNEESKKYSTDAMGMIMDNMKGYLDNDDKSSEKMLIAANLAGKAINITQTTAGHAMCYKITSLFGVSHGHAAALCDRVLYDWMANNPIGCIDPRGDEYLMNTLDEIGVVLGGKGAKDGARILGKIFDDLGLGIPEANEDEIKELSCSVNPVRLKNHPVLLSSETIEMLYHRILKVNKN